MKKIIRRNRKNNKNNQNNKNYFIYVLLGIFTVLLIILIYLSTSTENKIVEKEMKKDGFFTEETDAFYRKIISNNTIDDYYNSITKEKDVEYEEFLLLKESYDFTKLKMKHKKSSNTTINVSSNLKEEDISFNFELSDQNKYLLIEGNKENEYSCTPILKKNISSSEIDKYCEIITDEVDSYMIKKKEIIDNSKIMNIIKSK